MLSQALTYGILNDRVQPPQPLRPLRKLLHILITAQIQLPDLNHTLPSSTLLNVPRSRFTLLDAPAGDDNFFRVQPDVVASSFLAQASATQLESAMSPNKSTCQSTGIFFRVGAYVLAPVTIYVCPVQSLVGVGGVTKN